MLRVTLLPYTYFFIRIILNSNRTEINKMLLSVLPRNANGNNRNYFMTRKEGSLVERESYPQCNKG
jgi:hypothetical protein